MSGTAASRVEPIDAVYTWVDGADPAWQQKKRAALEALGVETKRLHHSAFSEARYASRDELRYSLRSLDRFAPFIRNIYLVTDRQTPPWLDVEHPKLRLVSHEELFPDSSHLPTFSSRAIECHLHRIRGLSERFLYFNDDVLLARSTTPADFFDEQGRSLVYLDRRPVVWDETSPYYDRPANTAARNGSRLLEAAFGYRITHRLDHVPYALRRSVLEELWERFPDELERLSAHRFRHPDTVTLTYSLAPHYAICSGRARSVEERHSTYVKVKRRPFSSWLLSFELLWTAMRRRGGRKFLSINDAGELDDGWLTRAAIALFLRLSYPGQSRFEWRQPDPTGGPTIRRQESEA